MILGAEDSAADGQGRARAGPARSAGRRGVGGEKIGSHAGAPFFFILVLGCKHPNLPSNRVKFKCLTLAQLGNYFNERLLEEDSAAGKRGDA